MRLRVSEKSRRAGERRVVVPNYGALSLGERQVEDVVAELKIAWLVASPCTQCWPRREASRAKLEGWPTGCRNSVRMLVTSFSQLSLETLRRVKIGANSEGIAPRLSFRI